MARGLHPQATPDYVATAALDYDAGMSLGETAQKHRVSESTLRKYFKREGVELRKYVRPKGGLSVDASQVLNCLEGLALDSTILVEIVLRKAMNECRRQARKIVAKYTGHLQQGIRIKITGSTATIYAFTKWGGIKRDYAKVVHEKHKTGGKFIEKPILQMAAGGYLKILTEAVRARLAGGQTFKNWTVDLESGEEVITRPGRKRKKA